MDDSLEVTVADVACANPAPPSASPSPAGILSPPNASQSPSRPLDVPPGPLLRQTTRAVHCISATRRLHNLEHSTAHQAQGARRGIIPVPARDEAGNRLMRADGEELLEAVRERKRGKSKSLIIAKANVHYTNSFGWTALHWAADRGLLEVTSMLLDYNADVNAQDLNNATPLLAAVKSNCLATARALLARGAEIDPKDQWNDTPLAVALDTGHTKMAAQLTAASKPPLHRLKGSKVVFSYPPSVYLPLKQLVGEVRRLPGGEEIFGIHDEPRLTVRGKTEGGTKGGSNDDVVDLEPPSPTKVTWTGPEVSWCHACSRANVAVQIAPEGDEYQKDEVCQEQAFFLQLRVKLDTIRQAIKQAEADANISEDGVGSEEETAHVTEEIERLEKVANLVVSKLRHFDDRINGDRSYLKSLSIQECKDDRKAEMMALKAEVDQLEGEVDPLVAKLHELLQNIRHVRLEEEIAMITGDIEKLKSKIRPVPPEADRTESDAVQQAAKAEIKKVTDNNKKLNEDIARREKSLKKTTDRLTDDLRTLEKPAERLTFLVNISARHFDRLTPQAFTLWLNWQTESNGKGNLSKKQKAAAAAAAQSAREAASLAALGADGILSKHQIPEGVGRLRPVRQGSGLIPKSVVHTHPSQGR